MHAKSFKKSERLHSYKLIQMLHDDGISVELSVLKFTYLVIDTALSGVDRQVLIHVPKRLIKRSVDRNLLKRRIREAYRLNRPTACVQNGKCVLLKYTYFVNTMASYKGIENDIIQSLEYIDNAM